MRRVDRPHAAERLLEMFNLREVDSPFAPQGQAAANPMGRALASSSGTDPQALSEVEDLLHKVLMAETGGPALAKIINKFLVDIGPYVGGQRQ